ncbi:MAG TPA: chemotaxis protein CheA [Terriglobia bacterium]|jgi:two-component system chemotaxis sensor kinase CheA
MSDSGRAFFEEFIDDYFAECEEHLTSIHALMLQLDNACQSGGPAENILDTLLRDFHSIKGLSAMVGMEEVTQLAHHLEDYFRELKEPGAEIKSDGITQALAAIAGIEEVLAARRRAEPLPDVTSLLLRLSQAVEEARPIRKGKAASVAAEAGEVTLGKWRFEFRPSSELAAQGITVSTVRERLAAYGQVTSAAPLILDDGSVAFEFIVATNEPESRFEGLRAEGLSYGPVAEQAQRPSSEPVTPSPSSPAGSVNLVRVDMSRLDDLMRIVGELVITRFHLDEALLNTEDALTPAGLRTLQDINITMERQVRQLRQTVIRTRLVPIGQIFERMRFVVRGLERDAQKKINVEISGQEAELDKVIVERMMDPLLHLVRNAVSHGIEAPQERINAGKPPEGELSLSAITSGDSVMIHIEDDGRGIDLEKVAARARSLGISGVNEALDSKRLLDVICSPGFTTRDEADLASGRGVGMAAVQSAVTDLGGIITLQTTAGQGTRFSIQLPLTLALADSLLVSVEGQRFAVPQASIREVFAVESSSSIVFENNEAITYRDGVLPIVRLVNIFNMKAKTRSRLHILVVGAGSNAVGLVVDRVEGQRQIVVRPITDPLLRIPGIVGATELGDGLPVLILDVHSMLRAHRMRAVSETRP